VPATWWTIIRAGGQLARDSAGITIGVSSRATRCPTYAQTALAARRRGARHDTASDGETSQQHADLQSRQGALAPINGAPSRVAAFVAQLIDLHGRPRAIRCDNGPELTSEAFTTWCKEQHIELRFIQPGKPDQNAYIERLNRTCREEVLSAYLFDSLDEVREITTEWMAKAARRSLKLRSIVGALRLP
jgi:Integrase core domain